MNLHSLPFTRHSGDQTMTTLSRHCPLTTDELQDLVCEAQNLLLEAIRTLDHYVAMTGDLATERYITDQLRVMASREDGLLSRDRNLDDVLAELVEHSEEEDDETAVVTGPALCN
jgi:hypothetical protein